MKVIINRCKNNYMWYKDKTPITTLVIDAKNKEELISNLHGVNNINDFYYSDEYKGLILKEDCEIL